MCPEALCLRAHHSKALSPEQAAPLQGNTIFLIQDRRDKQAFCCQHRWPWQSYYGTGTPSDLSISIGDRLAVVILFLVVLVGALCRKLRFFTDETIRGVTQLVVNITLPVLTVYNMQRPFETRVLINFLLTLGLSIVAILAALLGSLFLALAQRSGGDYTLALIDFLDNAKATLNEFDACPKGEVVED